MFNIDEEYKRVQSQIMNIEGDLVDSESGEILTQEDADAMIADAFNQMMSNESTGAEIAMKLIREQQRFIASIDLEIAHLGALKSSRKGRADSAKSAVLNNMLKTGTKIIETSVGRFSIRAGSKKTVVLDQDALESLSISDENFYECINVQVLKKPVLKVIKGLIESGKIEESVAKIVTGKKTLTVK